MGQIIRQWESSQLSNWFILKQLCLIGLLEGKKKGGGGDLKKGEGCQNLGVCSGIFIRPSGGDIIHNLNQWSYKKEPLSW